MKKGLSILLGLMTIVLIAGCGSKNEDTNNENAWANTVTSNTVSNNEVSHPEWVATSLTNEDIERIEETMLPLSYSYETWDSEAQAITDSGEYNAEEWKNNKLEIPEYKTMKSREVISSGIEDDMIYTITKITLEDGTELDVLYVNEPDTLFCRAISVQNGLKSTLYSNFVYDADK